MTTAGNRAIQRSGASAATNAPRRFTSASSVVLISSQVLPADSPAEQAGFRFHHVGGSRWRGQAGDQDIGRVGGMARRVGPDRALVQEFARPAAIELMQDHWKTVALQAAGQFATDIAQADEADRFHGRTVEVGIREPQGRSGTEHQEGSYAPATPCCHSREGGNPVEPSISWIPAFAGMTTGGLKKDGNVAISPPSFPRKREPRRAVCRRLEIPAFAGMTARVGRKALPFLVLCASVPLWFQPLHSPTSRDRPAHAHRMAGG